MAMTRTDYSCRFVHSDGEVDTFNNAGRFAHLRYHVRDRSLDPGRVGDQLRPEPSGLDHGIEIERTSPFSPMAATTDRRAS